MKYRDIFNPPVPPRPSKARAIMKRMREVERLEEAQKRIKVSNREDAWIHDPHVPGQQVHGHREDGRAVNKDGSLSHGGEPYHLTRAQADAFRREGFKIRKNRLVEGQGEGEQVTVTMSREVYDILIAIQKGLG